MHILSKMGIEHFHDFLVDRLLAANMKNVVYIAFTVKHKLLFSFDASGTLEKKNQCNMHYVALDTLAFFWI